MKETVIRYSLYARLEHDGKLLGYRFSRGFMRDYVDLSLDECSALLNHPVHEIPKQLERSSMMWFQTPYWSDDRMLQFHAGFTSGHRKIPVDKDMKPLKEWNDSVKLYRISGIESRIPVKSVHQTLTAVKAVDGLLYGTDFQDKFQIMSVNSVMLHPELIEVGTDLPTLGNTIVSAEMFSSFSVNDITEEEILEHWTTWCAQNGVKNISMTCTPMKKAYLLKLSTTTNMAVVPAKAPYPNFVGAMDLPAVGEFLPGPSRARTKKPLSYRGYVTSDGSIYRFTDMDNAADAGCTISSTNPVPPSKRKKYFFHRLMVCGNEIYEMDIARSNDWVKAVAQGAVPMFTRGVARLMQETVLEDYLLSETCDLPGCEVNGKTGILSVFKDSDLLEEFGPVHYLEVADTIQQEWAKNAENWEDWNWKGDVRAVETEVIWHEKRLELRLLVTL